MARATRPHPTRPVTRGTRPSPYLKMSAALGRHAREALTRGLRTRSLVTRAAGAHVHTTTLNHESHQSWQPSNSALLSSQAGGSGGGGGGWAQITSVTNPRGLAAATAAWVIGRRSNSTRVCEWAEKPRSSAPADGASPKRGFSSEADLEVSFHRLANEMLEKLEDKVAEWVGPPALARPIPRPGRLCFGS